jgi:hypothetical protein
MAVLFLVSFGMFGAITFIPLFFQGVMGATATASGGFLTPMQLGMIFANLTSGQVLARTGGHYKIQEAIGLGIASIGVFLLFTMTAQTSHLASMLCIVTLGVGMGTTMPLYTLIVQNAVPYEVMGTATSATQFFRSIGGAVGLAIFGSVMSNSFANQFITNFPASLKNSVPTNFVANMAANPQALVSVDPKTQIDTLYSQAGMTAGPGVADQIIAALRQSLAGAIHNVFFIALFIALLAFATHLFIKEVPLRKRHQSDKVTIQE